MFPRLQRISRANDDVFLKGRALHGERFSIRFILGSGEPPRFAVVVSGKKVGAVGRNRIKRRVRAALFSIAATVKSGVRVVVYAKPLSENISTSQITNDLKTLLLKAGLLSVENSRVKA